MTAKGGTKTSPVLQPDFGDDDPELLRELHKQMREDVVAESCFVYGAGRKVVPDEILRRMRDRELAAWAQSKNVTLAQVKAHLVERFPETKNKA
jgi:hypothetical protein